MRLRCRKQLQTANLVTLGSRDPPKKSFTALPIRANLIVVRYPTENAQLQTYASRNHTIPYIKSTAATNGRDMKESSVLARLYALTEMPITHKVVQVVLTNSLRVLSNA